MRINRGAASPAYTLRVHDFARAPQLKTCLAAAPAAAAAAARRRGIARPRSSRCARPRPAQVPHRPWHGTSGAAPGGRIGKAEPHQVLVHALSLRLVVTVRAAVAAIHVPVGPRDGRARRWRLGERDVVEVLARPPERRRHAPCLRVHAGPRPCRVAGQLPAQTRPQHRPPRVRRAGPRLRSAPSGRHRQPEALRDEGVHGDKRGTSAPLPVPVVGSGCGECSYVPLEVLDASMVNQSCAVPAAMTSNHILPSPSRSGRGMIKGYENGETER